MGSIGSELTIGIMSLSVQCSVPENSEHFAAA